MHYFPSEVAVGSMLSLQFLLGDPEVLSGQIRNLSSAAGSASPHRVSIHTYPENLQIEVPSRPEMTKPSKLALLT